MLEKKKIKLDLKQFLIVLVILSSDLSAVIVSFFELTVGDQERFLNILIPTLDVAAHRF